MKKTLLACTAFLFAITCGCISAQDITYHNAKKFTLIGKAFETGGHYHRVDTAKYSAMRLTVKRIFTNTAGLAVVFKTNSSVIHARWKNKHVFAANNMTPIGHSGVDLYVKDGKEWVLAGIGRPSIKGTESSWKLAGPLPVGEREYLLYLPLYNELTDLEIGIDKDAVIESLPNPFRKKIVVYGSSITQGASASRPGMAYTSRISRNTGLYLINLGLSGNGKMEPEVADMLSEIEGVDAFVLDCIANPTPEEISQRTAYMVKKIRSTYPDAPIIFVQRMPDSPSVLTPEDRKTVDRKNRNLEAEFDKLRAEGIKNLHMIRYDSSKFPDNEGTTDGIHPNDVGFSYLIDIIQPKLKKLVR